MEHEALNICVAMFYIVVLVKHIVFYCCKLLKLIITKFMIDKIILMCYKITATGWLQEAKCEVQRHKALIIYVAMFYIAVWLICLIVVRIRNQNR